MRHCLCTTRTSLQQYRPFYPPENPDRPRYRPRRQGQDQGPSPISRVAVSRRQYWRFDLASARVGKSGVAGCDSETRQGRPRARGGKWRAALGSGGGFQCFSHGLIGRAPTVHTREGRRRAGRLGESAASLRSGALAAAEIKRPGKIISPAPARRPAYSRAPPPWQGLTWPRVSSTKSASIGEVLEQQRPRRNDGASLCLVGSVHQ